MPDSLKSKTLQNVGFNSIARILQFVISGIASIILTRTLLPGDYGIVGFAGIVISFISQFGDIGISSAAVQKQNLDQTGVYTAFTLKLVLSLFVFLAAFVTAPLVQLFFDNEAIVGVVRVLALSFLLNCGSFLPNLLLSRDLDYKKISYANALSAMVNSTAAVVLALLGFKYWSIVVAGLLMSISLAVLLNFFRPIRYRLRYDHQTAKGFLRFGGNLFISGLTIFLIFNADNFIIGSLKGADALGYYSVAFTWATMSCLLISSVILTVLFPTFSRIQDDRAKIKRSYLELVRYVSFGGVLINSTLFVVAGDFLVLVLGRDSDKWLPALPSLRILCFYGIARLLLEPAGPVAMALGRTDVTRKATFLVAAIELGLLYPVLQLFGIEGVAVLVTAAYLSQYAVYYPLLKKELKIGLGRRT